MKINLYIASLILVMLAGCATPQTILKNHNGDVVSCGGSSTGSVVGGMIGYSIQKNSDDICVKNYMGQGYNPVKIDNIKVNE